MAQQVVNGMGMISKLLSAPIAMQQGGQVEPDQKEEDDDKKTQTVHCVVRISQCAEQVSGRITLGHCSS
jgi:hypothetical protein